MDQLIPSLAALVASYRDCFARPETFATFQHLIAGWITALGPRTISEVWQATGRAAHHHWDTAYSFFASAKWDWDELGKILVLMVVARLVPTGTVWIVVDDTLCHKRGAKVAFGGFFLDAVTSTKRKKNFRFGVNWIVVGLSVHLPFRPDRAFTLPVLWRAYRKKGTDGHRTRSTTAVELARLVATALPDRDCWLIGDGAYLNKTTLADRPKNLQVLGPLRWNAALHRPPEPRPAGKKPGRPRVYGDRLPTPKAMIEDTKAFPATTLRMRFGETERKLRVQVLGDARWRGAKREPVTVILIRDAAGEWRDEVLLATGRDVPAAFALSGYCRRWGIEVAFFESKQLLGLHDPRVRVSASVERAHPLAWFVQTLTVVWYAGSGHAGPHVERDRPWYATKVGVTFADMLSALRLRQWDQYISRELAGGRTPEELLNRLKHQLAAVR